MLAKTFLERIVFSISQNSYEKDTLDVFEPTVYLKNGDYLSEWGINGNVVELPGHTNGSIGLGIEDDKLFESQNKIGNG